MTRNEIGGLSLTDDETKALARYLIARHVQGVVEYGGDIEWESVPELDEDTWYMVEEALRNEVDEMFKHVDVNGVDARYVWKNAS